MTPSSPSRLAEALRRLDAANAEDPRTEGVEGVARPRELVYAERMSAWLERLVPDASEALRLAVRAQHLRRWAIPRSDFPEGRAGYLQWRARLARFHAETAGQLLREVGYPEETVQRVQALVRKERLKADPEAQALEDVACLVFLESYLADFARSRDEAQLVAILRKTWRKMSPAGHRAALALPLGAGLGALVDRALAGEPS